MAVPSAVRRTGCSKSVAPHKAAVPPSRSAESKSRFMERSSPGKGPWPHGEANLPYTSIRGPDPRASPWCCGLFVGQFETLLDRHDVAGSLPFPLHEERRMTALPWHGKDEREITDMGGPELLIGDKAVLETS